MALSVEDKKRFLRALEEDEEFRYAVAGLLGLGEILRELKQLREDVKRLWEGVLDHSRRLDGVERELGRIDEKLSEQDRLLRDLHKEVLSIRAQVGGFTARAGLGLERLVLEIYRDLLEHRGIRADKVEKISIKDIDGKWLRRGARIELDVYVHNDDIWFIEVKTFLEVDDVEWFQTRCEIMEKVLGRKPTRRLIVAIDATRDALERARELGIEVIYTNLH